MQVDKVDVRKVIAMATSSLLVLSITQIPSSFSVSNDIDYVIVFLSSYDICSNDNYNALNFYSYLTKQWYQFHGYRAQEELSACVSQKQFSHIEPEPFLTIIVTDFLISLKEIVREEVYNQNHCDEDIPGSIGGCWTGERVTTFDSSGKVVSDKYSKHAILVRSLNWVQGSWALSHELSHMLHRHVLVHDELDKTHEIDDSYDLCSEKSKCAELWFAMHYPANGKSYRLMETPIGYEQPKQVIVVPEQKETFVSISTDKQSYDYLQEIIAYVQIDNAVKGGVLLVEVRDTDFNIIVSKQVQIHSDGSYTSTVNLGDSKSGHYYIKAIHGGKSSVILVYYAGKQVQQELEPEEPSELWEIIGEIVLSGSSDKPTFERILVEGVDWNSRLKVGQTGVVKMTVTYLDYSGSYMAIFKVSKGDITHYIEVKNSFNGDVMITWKPSERGTYTIEMFTWASLKNPVPLGSAVSLTTVVN